MQEIIAHLINKLYHLYQGKIFPEQEMGIASHFLEFGGFQLSYDWYGRSRISGEMLGKVIIYKKVIHFDNRFLYKLADLHSFNDGYNEEYNLKRLIHTIAHEVAHCLLGDYSLELFRYHGWFHDGLTILLENYLWKTQEVKELEKLQKSPKKKLC